ncbi:hypothetical protein QYE76_056366 [Lolium multiflorum]|uniref:Reverse transcriptase Ty1/copia-type domain-containing protein n=1 Tax=Lolium multiflorum TaxID=4521 RepID=A0AAD8T213_LOLMU|nr:hypothetical protein QYE76_056366 [Lolium multiflorum]
MMGELKYFLGFEIKQMRQGTFINQAKYVQDMLKRFDMKGANGIGTPMHLKCQLTLDETGKAVDPKLYRSMIVFDLRYRVGTDLSNPSLSPTHLKSKAAPKLRRLEEISPDLLLRPSPVNYPPWRSFPTSFLTMASGMNSNLSL